MHLRLATRGSTLALVQTELVRKSLANLSSQISTSIITIQTTGDKKQGTEAARISDKRDWIHELELAVVNGDAELAVHSAKDVPAEIHKDTFLIPILPREQPFDILIRKRNTTIDTTSRFDSLPPGAIIGTSSLRRQAQIFMLRPDLLVVEHRGNVTTRIQKLEQSQELTGIILAQAGITRLGIENLFYEVLSPPCFLPAVNQGILVAQIRRDNKEAEMVLNKLKHSDTAYAFQAERACISVLQADCNSAVCVYAKVLGNKISLHTRVMLPDGSEFIEVKEEAKALQAQELGLKVGNMLITKGAARILERSRYPIAPVTQDKK